jgi:copper transporter 1
MVFTMSHKNLCIIFPQWRITSIPSLIISLLAIVAITAGYELLRESSRRYEARCAASADKTYIPSSERERERSPHRQEGNEEGFVGMCHVSLL